MNLFIRSELADWVRTYADECEISITTAVERAIRTLKQTTEGEKIDGKEG